MEEQNRRLSLGGILRFLLGVLIVVIVVFLLVRFIDARRSRSSEKSQQIATENQASNDQKKNSEGKESSPDSEGTSSEAQDNGGEAPTGIADSSSVSDAQTGVPATGMGGSVLYLALLLGGATFVIYEVVQARSR